jgi:hypothetical protein
MNKFTGLEVLNDYREENCWGKFDASPELALAIWARLACKWIRELPSTPPLEAVEFSRGGLLEWAQSIKNLARLGEAFDPPLAECKYLSEITTIQLWWGGTWTQERSVLIHIGLSPNQLTTISFNTGTGKPSSFLDKIFEDSLKEDEYTEVEY